jgi:hypothetical protein
MGTKVRTNVVSMRNFVRPMVFKATAKSKNGEAECEPGRQNTRLERTRHEVALFGVERSSRSSAALCGLSTQL